ncbi:Phosphopantetheine attachment site [Micromonospora pallida]|uniref:Phosphopantetheine attachment site n=1 Tax=Micromonospora pallida TaxID=145854 RepID=A0A1C6RUM6_9ACTN|nr:phosphopantetheine-binding protein [Micromonospora pallida]SCL20782.1 Phosphopantetheine attachment site [Micromonospora pallida]
MTEQAWTAPFEETLRRYLTLLPPGTPISEDLSLATYGVDSLATVSLLLDLEEAFDVTFPDHLLTESTFATPAGLWAVIDSLLVHDSAR